jgi:3-deoxy-D-manno-octulosonic-acid transferase
MIQKTLYNLSIYSYDLAIKIASIFNKKAKKLIVGRSNIGHQLSVIKKDSSDYKLKTGDWELAWFHCASLGEFEQGRPVIERFKKEFPNYKIVLTFFSPSGYEIRKNYEGADYVLYLPSDTPAHAKQFIDAINPSIVFFVKYEFWRNYLDELNIRQIPTLLFSAIFRPNQVFFKWYGGFFRESIQRFNHIFVQNENSKNLLQSIDYQEVIIAGDTRFDRVKEIVENKKRIEIVERFKGNKQIFIAGSVWEEDIIQIKNSLTLVEGGEGLFIIAPHEINHSQIENWQKQISLKSIKFSEVKEDTQLSEYQVLIIDNIGMLSSLYQYTEYAYIGGSFGKGLHNILEAATYGLPIMFGNKAFHKFQEAVDLINLGGAFAISDSDELINKFKEISKTESKRKQIGQICSSYVLINTGATEKVIELTKEILNHK